MRLCSPCLLLAVVAAQQLAVLASFWQPSPSISFCAFLDDIDFIYHLGDYLLLAASPSKSFSKSTPESLFYLFDWQAGQLHGQPRTLSELFGQVKTEDDGPDGRLLFATSFDMCLLKLDDGASAAIRYRRKRQFDMSNEMASFDFSNLDPQTKFDQQKASALMQELDSKLIEFRQNNKKELANAVLELKRQLTGLGQTLLLSQAQQRLLLSAMMKRPSSADSSEAGQATTVKSNQQLQAEMLAKLEALYRNLTSLTSKSHNDVYHDNYNYNSGISNTQEENMNPFGSFLGDSQQAKPLDFRSQNFPPHDFAQQDNFMPPNSAPRNFAPQENSAPQLVDLQPPCPRVVLATFAHSKYNWEGRLCSDKRPPWLKTVLYQYGAPADSRSKVPTLTPMVLSEKSFSLLLTYRGRVQVDDSRFVQLRTDLACPDNLAPKTINQILAGFRINGRVFVQLKRGQVSELVNSQYLPPVSIAELLNCYGNSSIFTLPLSVIGAPQAMTLEKQSPRKMAEKEKDKRHKKLNKWEDSGSSGDDEYKSLKLNSDDDEEDSDYDLGRNVKASKKRKKTSAPRYKVYTRKKVTQAKVRLKSAIADKPMIANVERDSAISREQQLNGAKQGAMRSVEDDQERRREQRLPKKESYMFYYAGAALVALLGYWCFCASNDDEDVKAQKRRKKRKSQKKKQKSREKRKKHSRRSKSTTKRRTRGRSVSRALRRSRSLRKSLDQQTSRPSPAHALSAPQSTPQVPPANVTVSTAGEFQVQNAGTESNKSDLDRVIVLDPEKMHHLGGSDTEMANRLESMLGESRVISQLMEMKRYLGVDQLPEGRSEHAKSSQLPTKTATEEPPLTSPLSSSADISSPGRSINYASDDESVRLVQVLHRMRKSLSSKTPTCKST